MGDHTPGNRDRKVPCGNAPTCQNLVRVTTKYGLCATCFAPRRADLLAGRIPAAQAPPPTAIEQVAADRERKQAVSAYRLLQGKYAEALRTIESQERDLRALNVLGGIETFSIVPREKSGTAEGAVVMVASDWHCEERVDPKTINGVNEYSLEIAERRATGFFQGGLRLTRLLQQDISIKTIVLPLLGDFISNDIHEEFADLTDAQPVKAIVFAQKLIASGIEFLLEHSKCDLVVPCHSGNHGRTTKTTRFGSEAGHSLEYLMYLMLAAYFRNEPRVKFVVSEGYHSYLKVYDLDIRFHHGHAIKYQGGVGGITIPVLKAISQWDKVRRADLDVFGHFHQLRDGGKWMSNGALIGYNAYSQSIKSDFETPRQLLFLLDKQRGRTCTWPILVDRKK
jgi:hypothetical protein